MSTHKHPQVTHDPLSPPLTPSGPPQPLRSPFSPRGLFLAPLHLFLATSGPRLTLSNHTRETHVRLM